jgi:predicted hotdog family 3-hydroxylacyl-ACP dehydratase
MNAAPALSISQLLPHKGRLCLLDELLELHAERIVTALTIRADSTLCDGVNGVPAWVGMEYMAQTACAFAGAEERRAGRQPSISVLLGTRRYQTSVPVFPLGARLVITAELVLRDESNLAAFDCTIHSGPTELARGDIKALRPDNLAALIEQQRL